MNHLPKHWLHWLHVAYIVLDVVFLCGFAYMHFGHVGASIQALWGLTPLILGLVCLHLAYGVLVYPFLQKRYAFIAIAISHALFSLLIAAAIETSFETNSVYWGVWTVMVLASAMIGVVLLIAELSLQAMLDIFTVLGLLKTRKAPLGVDFIWLGVDLLAGLAGWFFFRHYYQISEAGPDKLSELSKLLQQEQSQSNLIVQSIADGIIVFDRSGMISIINASAAALTEWTEKEAIGIDVRLVMKLMAENGKPITETDDIFKTVLDHKQHVSQILQMVGRRGKATIVSLVVSPILTDGGANIVGAVAVVRDVTSQRQEEKQRAEFISTASHEMRTPVAAIEGYLALALNDKVSSIDSKAREYLEKAHESTEHLGKLFQDLLTSARAEDGRLSSHPVVIEMGEYLERLADSLRLVAAAKQLALEFVIGNNEIIDATSSEGGQHVVKPLYYAFADPDRVREVITNLFDNAVKYTDQGKVSIGLTGDETVVQLYVRDTGLGIPAADIPHLFQKFYRVDSSATRTIGGTGLGLFISRKIIELYKGRIWVESEEGKGSTFFINLPRLDSQRASQLQAAEAAQTTLPNLTSEP